MDLTAVALTTTTTSAAAVSAGLAAVRRRRRRSLLHRSRRDRALDAVHRDLETALEAADAAYGHARRLVYDGYPQGLPPWVELTVEQEQALDDDSRARELVEQLRAELRELRRAV